MTDQPNPVLKQLADAVGNLLAAGEKEMADRAKAAAPHNAAKAAGKIDDLNDLVSFYFDHRAEWVSKDDSKENEMTRRVLRCQLQENTGARITDSGMYGRGWERAATRDFEGEKFGFLRFILHYQAEQIFEDKHITAQWTNLAHPIPEHYTLEMEVALSGYHAFAQQARYLPGLNYLYHKVYAAEMDAKRDPDWRGKITKTTYDDLTAGFTGWLKTKSGIEAEEDDRAYNTANYSTTINEIYRYNRFDITDVQATEEDGVTPTFAAQYGIEEGSYWIMETHNGADVMYGYSCPVIYKINCSEGYVNFSDLSIGCDTCGVYWDSVDAGYSFISQERPWGDRQFATKTEYNKDGSVKEIGWTFDVDNEENRLKYFGIPIPTEPAPKGFKQLKLLKGKNLPPLAKRHDEVTDVLLVDEDTHVALCPICHKGHIVLSEPYYDC